MTDYSRPPSFDFEKAIFQGFNLPGGKGYFFRVAGWGALLITIIYVSLGGPVVSAYIDVFKNAIEMEFNLDGPDPDPNVWFATMAPMFRAVGMIFLISIFQIVVFASAETAIYRNLLHEEDRGIFPLTFGMDELRVLGTRIVVGLILYGVILGIYIVTLIIAAVLFGLAGAADSGGLAAIGGILIFLLILAAIAAFIWIAVRLAPASAFSVKNRAFNPVASWGHMKGLVWPAIGSFLILYLLGYFILGFLVWFIFMGLFFSSGIIGVFMELDDSTSEFPDFSPVVEHFTSAGFIIPLVIAIFISMFLSMIWYGSIWSLWGYFAKTEWSDLQTPKQDEDVALW